MALNINSRSKDVITRFVLKVIIGGGIAALDPHPFCLAMAKWIGLYAAVTPTFALLRYESFERDTFTRWDETLWLLAVSLFFIVLHKGIG